MHISKQLGVGTLHLLCPPFTLKRLHVSAQFVAVVVVARIEQWYAKYAYTR